MRHKPPFHVRRDVLRAGKWRLYMRGASGIGIGTPVGLFDSQAEAIDFAYRRWPWWL